MKKYTHAWLALKAVELLENKKQSFDCDSQKSLNRFLNFINEFPSTFVRGAWFPDTIIKDNVQGGHTWKYRFDENGQVSKYRVPGSVTCSFLFNDNDFNKKISLETGISDLPDRCEALSQSIRDMIQIINILSSGDVISFNNSQLATFFLMLSHYIADAHMPLHCDSRDFYTPSTVHPDIEDLWEKEIEQYFAISKKKEQFDLDEEGRVQRNKKQGFDESFLSGIDDITIKTAWENSGNSWNRFLGKKNNNVWDYLVGVCHVSFLMSHMLLPENELQKNYDIKIKDNPVIYQRIKGRSAGILADAITSIAIIWLTTWLRWELLKKGEK